MAVTTTPIYDPIALILTADDASFELLRANFTTGQVTSSVLTSKACSMLSERLGDIFARCASKAALESGFAEMVASMVHLADPAGNASVAAAYGAPEATLTVSGQVNPSTLLVTIPHSTSSPWGVSAQQQQQGGTLTLNQLVMNESAPGFDDQLITTADSAPGSIGLDLVISTGTGDRGGQIRCYLPAATAESYTGPGGSFVAGPGGPPDEVAGWGGGEGGSFSFEGGTGGAACRLHAAIPGQTQGGLGGNFTFIGGTGGGDLITPATGCGAGDGGTVNFQGGAGGFSVTTGNGGNGGDVVLRGGQPGTSSGGGANGEQGRILAPSGICLNTDGSWGSQPAAAERWRGMFWMVQGGAGVADSLQVCVKTAADTYVWKTVTLV